MKKLMQRALLGLAMVGIAAPALAAGNDRFIDVIVSLKSFDGPAAAASNRARAREVARGYGVATSHTYGAVFSGFAARVPEGRLQALRNDPRVLSVSLDGTAHAIAKPCNPKHGCDGGGDGGGGQTLPWGVDRIDADANGNTGAGVHVYVIDTGIDADHPDLAANLGNGFAAATCKGGQCVTDWDDDEGHGTHVAGTVGALDNDSGVVGVAPGVTLHAVKVLNNRGSGSFSDIIAGIDWAAQETAARGTAAVANMSLGGGGSKTGSCTDSGFSGDDNFHRAICNAKNVGLVFAVAAGNEDVDADTTVPAAYDDAVVTVSATSEGDDWPYWSNWGDRSAGWTSHASAPVAIAAPGVGILSLQAGGGTTTLSGTSMASPHVAGALALYLASSPHGNSGQAFTDARNTLLSTDESTSGFSNTSGNPHDEDFLDAATL